MEKEIEIGVLYSHSGGYENMSLASRRGVYSAVKAINGSDEYPFVFRIIERDPEGNADHYGPLAEDIFKSSQVKHIFGCTTSWSRKEVIPFLERYDGTLWYTVPYEGFEASDHVAYTHACPNQHLIPLLKWAMPRFGGSAYLIGSNYIWGWEMNRLAREIITANGGEVLGERYLPIGDLDVERMVDEIHQTRPDFILNSLIGTSQYHFLQKFSAQSSRSSNPILSCNLTECELSSIGMSAEGLISAGPYFAGSEGTAFQNSFEEASYRAVFEYANLLKIKGAESSYDTIKNLLAGIPANQRTLNSRNHHVSLPVKIGMVQNKKFKILETHELIAGDPYLTNTPRSFLADRPALRLVQ